MSSTSPTDSGARPAPAKRLRIGTKSCQECRRRKVRCIFTPDNPVCKECTIHDAPCTSQQPKRQETIPYEASEQHRLQQRVDELQTILCHVCKTINIDSSLESLNLSHLENHTSKTQTGPQLELTPDPKFYDISPTKSKTSLDGSNSGHDVSASGSKINHFRERAPLLEFFKEAMMIETNSQPILKSRGEGARDPAVQHYSTVLKTLVPSQDDLTLILEVTEKFWPIWPVTPKTQKTRSIYQLRPVVMARDFIAESLMMNSPAAIAKGVLWLALCVQQLPADFVQYCSSLAASLEDLISSYMSNADRLISIDEQLGGTIEGLEALALKSALYVNMGKPRKAWSAFRRGIDQAILLGLHHPQDGIDQRSRSLWTYFWQRDRQMSLVLGFPYSIADSHPGLLMSHTDTSTYSHVAHKIGIISGHIAERNQNYQEADYSITMQIAEELKTCGEKIPREWWHNTNPTMSLDALYSLQTLKLIYFQHLKILHLPFMLKSNTNKSYEPNRIATLEATRGMISAYRALRDGTGISIVMCDLMDFQIFTAVIVLIINLFSCSGDTLEQQAKDWDLVSYTTSTLKKVSEVMDCAVARQASQILDYLLQAHDGAYAGPEAYEAVIPYFGRVRIRHPSSATAVTLPSSEQVIKPVTQYSLEVEFSTDPFGSFGLGGESDTLTDAELGVDWTAMLDQRNDYEYSQLFNMPGLSGD